MVEAEMMAVEEMVEEVETVREKAEAAVKGTEE